MWGRVALVLTGVVVVVIAGYMVERFWVRDSVVASAPTTAVVETPPENGPSENGEQKPPESDVARERAALDAPRQ